MGTAAIIGLIASIVGAGIQMYSSYQANKDAQDIINRAQEQNSEDHKKLIDNINAETTNYAAEKRKEQQDALASELESGFKTPVSESQAVRAQQQTTQGDVSDDYSRAKAQSDERTQNTINTLANLMGRVKSSNRLRMNEGIRLADMASENDWLSSNAQYRTKAAEISAQDALNSYNNLKALGQGIGAIGTALSLGSSAAGSAAGSAASNAASTGVTNTGAQLAASNAPNYAASAAVFGAKTAGANPSLWFNFAGDTTKAGLNDAWRKAFTSGNFAKVL